jgi:hypothetical protein
MVLNVVKDFHVQESVMMGSNSNRYSLGFNSTAQVTKKLKIGTNINAIYRNINIKFRHF